MRALCCIFLSLALISPALSGEEKASSPLWQQAPSPSVDWEEVSWFYDLKDTFFTSLNAGWKQFVFEDSRNALLAGGIITWGIDRADEDILRAFQRNDFLRNEVFEVLGDEVALAASLSPILIYAISRKIEDEKLRAFAMETWSALTLSYIETIALSFGGFHERPRNRAGNPAHSFFDTKLRGDSSFPSGHIKGPFIVMLKAWDYYGWKGAAIPAILTVVTIADRVSNGSHFLSDMAGSLALGTSAHLATKRLYNERFDKFRIGASPMRGGGIMVRCGWEF